MRQPTTAEVRFDEHKAASFGPVGPSILPFWLSTSRLRSNFVAADPPATEDQVQQAGNPENVGSIAPNQPGNSGEPSLIIYLEDIEPL